MISTLTPDGGLTVKFDPKDCERYNALPATPPGRKVKARSGAIEFGPDGELSSAGELTVRGWYFADWLRDQAIASGSAQTPNPSGG